MLALLMPILAACGGGGTTTAPTAMADATAAPAAGGEATTGAPKIAVEDGAELRVASWGDPAEQKVNTDSFARFNQMYPNVRHGSK